MSVMTRSDSPVTFALPDLAATAALGRRLAALLRPGDVVALKGDLGAGKTTLAREIVAALSPETDEVPSPTFTLVQTYPTAIGELWHFDLYRLERAEQIYELGLEEALAGGISLIEWPELIERLLPRGKVLNVALLLGADGTRSATLSGGAAWTERLANIRSSDPS
jgi:tRNA threonylcarbamoyladenosine biosynthesis protein TsaE